MLEKRKKDFEKLIKGLDISPTMFKNAEEKYRNLAKYLNDNGIESEIYPQGSFATGTVVRPYKNGKEMDYDLDFICKIIKEKDETTPKKSRLEIKEALENNEIYRTRLTEYDKCLTLNYADIGGVGFNMDILNAVNDEKASINHGVAITNKISEEKYEWVTINPKAYKEWFDDINDPFLKYMKDNRKKQLLESYNFYDSVEDIPNYVIKTPLQQSIQILKRHRDMFYHKKKKEKEKPISTIIVTICSKIAETAPLNYDTVDLLKFIVKEFNSYSDLCSIEESSMSKIFNSKMIMQKEKGKWKIENPVNPEDNLADSWNDNPEKASLFFKWVEAVQKEFVDSFNHEDEQFIVLLESAVGSAYLNKVLKKETYTKEITSIIEEPKKSWRKI